MVKSLWQGVVRMNLVVGHHEGESCCDTRVGQKAAGDDDHYAPRDETLRVGGFFPCRMVGASGQENTQL